MIGLALGSVAVTTLVDEFFELGERELPFRLFLVLWMPALVGALIGGMYNEIMHGSPLFIALLKIGAAISGCSVCTFVWLFLIQAVDGHIARNAPLERQD